jgi:hypothetical protein
VQRQAEPEEEDSALDSLSTRDADDLRENKDEEEVQTKSNTGAAQQITPRVAREIYSLKGGGQPLPASERRFFEPRFGVDFGKVRVHTYNRAALVARSIKAHAFTFGRDVVFWTGQYSPGSHSGRRLLAHELTHVVQQRSAGHNKGYIRNSQLVNNL